MGDEDEGSMLTLSRKELNDLSVKEGEVYAKEVKCGVYKCSQCGNVLYTSDDKYQALCK